MLQGSRASVSSLHYLEPFLHVSEHLFISSDLHMVHVHAFTVYLEGTLHDNDIRILPVVNLGSLDLSADVLKSLNSVLMMMSAH